MVDDGDLHANLKQIAAVKHCCNTSNRKSRLIRQTSDKTLTALRQSSYLEMSFLSTAKAFEVITVNPEIISESRSLREILITNRCRFIYCTLSKSSSIVVEFFAENLSFSKHVNDESVE